MSSIGYIAGGVVVLAGIGVGVAGLVPKLDWVVVGIGGAVSVVGLGIIGGSWCWSGKKEEKKQEKVTGPQKNYEPQIVKTTVWLSGAKKRTGVMWNANLAAQNTWTYTMDGTRVPDRRASPMAPFEDDRLS